MGEGHRKRSGISETKVSHWGLSSREGENLPKFYLYDLREKVDSRERNKEKRNEGGEHGREEQSCFPGKFYGGRKGGQRERHMSVLGNESREE